jgi:hypothetical protein
MNTQETEGWDIVLSENTERETAAQPFWTVKKASIDDTVWECAAWLNKVKSGPNLGRPFIGLCLKVDGEASAPKVNISLWKISIVKPTLSLILKRAKIY